MRYGILALGLITACTHTPQEQQAQETIAVGASSVADAAVETEDNGERLVDPNFEAKSYFSLTNYSPGPREIGRARYPRNHMVQFKKVSKEDVSDRLAIKAMLDDPTGYIGSPFRKLAAPHYENLPHL